MALAGIREASRLIFVDELTGLYNRRFMRQYLRDRLGQLEAERTPLAVIMLDLDGFKQVNDTYGHLAGDQILQELARLIKELLPPNGYAIRFAGDEFFVFVEGVDAAGGVLVAEKIRARVGAGPFATDKAPGGIPVGMSLGVAGYPEDAPSPSELIEAADQALYRSKRSGKNCVSRAGGWRPPLEAQVLRRFPCPRLVGRERELAELERPILDGGARGNHFLLVEARRGLGKSRLLLEVMRQAGARGLRPVFGRCLDSERAIPYASLASVLATHLDREPRHREQARQRLAPASLAALGTRIPALAGPEGQGDPPTPEERRSTLFHAMGDLLCLLSAEAPLVILLDDLQFVDEASLEVLSRLLDRQEGRVLVYAAAQSEAFAAGEGSPLPLVRLFSLLRQSPNFQRIELGALSSAEVGRMVSEILERHTPSPAFFARLFEASAGIPLYVEEALKGLITRGALKPSDTHWDLDGVEPAAVPASLETAIQTGLDALDREIHAMIAKAAVVGPHVDLEVLSGVLGTNPSETQQLVDKGKKHRVFEEPGVLADEEEVRFLSQCFQQIVYSGLDAADRRRTHRAVGEVTERLAGTRTDQVLGPLAYHFERSDDPVKGEFYRQRVQTVSGELFSAAEIARELGLKVGTDEVFPRLDERTWPFADRFLRALTVAVKSMRVYPEGSQLVAQSVEAAKARLVEALARVESVTFAEEGQALQINGQPVEGIGLLPVSQDLLRIYADHGIRRCTFERGATAGDLMGLLRILSGPPEGTQHDVQYWEARLKKERINHLRVFPVIYLAAGSGTTVWRREQTETLLDDPTLVLVRDVLRSLAASVDNIRLYPPESQLIALSLDQLERQSQALFARVPTLTVAMAEGAIVVNATRPNPRLFGITIEILQKLMEDSDLTSLTIRRGVTREQLRVFLTHLAQSGSMAQRDPAFWRGLLQERGITTIEVGTRTYAAAGRLEEVDLPVGEAPEAGTPRPTAPQSSEAQLALERAAQWLKEALPAFLQGPLQEEIARALAPLRGMGREDLAAQLADRTAAALGETDPRLRRQAAEGLSCLLRGAEGDTGPWLVGRMVEPLARAARSEGDPEAFQSEAALAGDLLRRLLADGDLAAAGRLSEGLGAGMRARGEPSKFAETLRRLLEGLGAATLDAILAGLRGEDPGRRQQAGAILAPLGAAAVPLLLRWIHEGQEEETVRAAAAVLATQGERSVRALTGELERPGATVEQVIRVVSLLDVIAPALGNEFLPLLGHPEVEVRAELARVLTRVPREYAMRFLGHALSQKRQEVVLGALECVRGLQGVELLDSVVALVETPPGESVLRAACLCLGRLRDPRAVAPLLSVLERRPRFFGLVKGLPEGIRATAARSLGELALPEARAGLLWAQKDRSKAVRSAARLALLRLEQAREARGEE
jgi:diguanylate cyclase (GGDEF)-like protein